MIIFELRMEKEGESGGKPLTTQGSGNRVVPWYALSQWGFP